MSAQTLREKNIALIEAITDIFGLGRAWPKVKASLSVAQVREFYAFIARLWPVDTDLSTLLPKPDSTLRALYLGEYEPEVMLENVFRFCLYADQIVLVNPFDNPNIMADEYNPIHHPDEWKLQTLRLIFHLALLAPWIQAGLVVLVPDPGDFDRQLRVKAWDLAKERLKGWEPSEEDIENTAMKRRAMRMFLLHPRQYMERTLRESNPSICDDEVRQFLDFVERERENDPLLLNETLDRMPAQIMTTRTGGNLETGMYICQATGAFPYTNLKFRWREIMGARQELNSTAQLWSPLTNAFQQLRFKFLDKIDSKFAYSLRHDGRLEGFRSYLRKLWITLGGEPDPTKSEELARDFRDELTQAFNGAKADWDAIDRDLLNGAFLRWGSDCHRYFVSPLTRRRFRRRRHHRTSSSYHEETRVSEQGSHVSVH